MDPRVRSCDRREAISERGSPVSFDPVAVGFPSGASAVYCRNANGRASNSAAAGDGWDVVSNIMAVIGAIACAIHLRRVEESMTSDDNAVHEAAIIKLADNMGKVAMIM